MSKNKITLNMDMLLYGRNFFEKLSNLKDGETIELSSIVFYGFEYGKELHTTLYTASSDNEILMNQFSAEIKKLGDKLLSILDVSCYSEELNRGKHYHLMTYFISIKGEEIKATINLADHAKNALADEAFDDKGVLQELVELLERIETECSRMLNNYTTIKDQNEYREEGLCTAKLDYDIENEEGLMFAIEGKEWNLYKGTSNLSDIKNAFINCPAGNDDGHNDYKYIALTNSDDTGHINTLALTYNNMFIIEEGAVAGRCIYPIKVKELMNMLSELAEHYRNLGYEIVTRF